MCRILSIHNIRGPLPERPRFGGSQGAGCPKQRRSSRKLQSRCPRLAKVHPTELHFSKMLQERGPMWTHKMVLRVEKKLNQVSSWPIEPHRVPWRPKVLAEQNVGPTLPWVPQSMVSSCHPLRHSGTPRPKFGTSQLNPAQIKQHDPCFFAGASPGSPLQQQPGFLKGTGTLP